LFFFIFLIGGIGTIEGPIIRTLIFFALRESFVDPGTTYLIVLGLVTSVCDVKGDERSVGVIRAPIAASYGGGPAVLNRRKTVD